MTPGIHVTQCGEDIIYIGASFAELVKSVCKDIQSTKDQGSANKRSAIFLLLIPSLLHSVETGTDLQKFRVRIGIHVPVSFYIQKSTKVSGIHEIPVHAH